MNEKIAELVFPVFRYALRLKERLRYEKLEEEDEQWRFLRQEQAELTQRINAAADFTRQRGPGEFGDNFLGVGYALACWLDDFFILDPECPLRELWRESSIEFALYHSQDRAQLFYMQAHQAERRADFDALEVFYLCLMLGFRGELRDNPPEVRKWRSRFESVIRKGGGFTPAELPAPPATAGMLLVGREWLRWGLLAWALIGSVAILLAVFTVVYRWGS